MTCLLLLLWSAVAPLSPIARGSDPPQAKRIVVIAHRGANKFAPENTLAAFRKAIELGCDYVELDVRRTGDGALVLMHDRTVDRTTEGKGAVDQMTLADIRKLDAGIKNGERFKGEKVPTFDDALKLCKNRIKVYVDNKAGPPDEVMAAILKRGMLKQVIIYGGVETLKQFKKTRLDVWVMPDHPKTMEELRKLAAKLKPETLDGNLRQWTPEMVKASHELGIQVWVDNLGENDNETGFAKALDMGVDAIQTDIPTF